MELLFSITGAPPDALTPRHIIEFLGRPGLTATSKSTYHATIRAYCKWCVATDVRLDNPAAKTPIPRRPRLPPRPLPNEDLRKLLAVRSEASTAMMILLAAAHGMRVHEIAKVRGEHFADGRQRIHGKGDATKIIPVHPSVADRMHEFPREGYWFSGTAPDTCVKTDAVRRAIYRAMKRAGVKGSPHMLRHWFGTSLLESGADLRTVQELMRHESIASTEIYTLVTSERKSQAMHRLKMPAANLTAA